MFSHPQATRSWEKYEITRDGLVAVVLHVEHSAGQMPEGLSDAVVEYMKQHTEIDRAEIQSEQDKGA